MNRLNRRAFGKLSATAALSALLPGESDAQTPQTQPTPEQVAAAQHMEAMTRYPRFLEGPKVTIAMLAYPGMFLQDLVGPLTMFEAMMNRDVHLVWKTKEPLTTGSAIPVTPTMTFKDCPRNLDVLFVPGGVPGTMAMMEDAEVMGFLAEQGKTAKYITSVCTGSLILGAAGLLKGYKATSHWATRDVLKIFGAIPTDGRVVTDRNRITGGGVTAGLDFGLALVAKLRDRTYAEAVQLYLEYDPHPPFNAGSPKTAGKEQKGFIDEMFAPMVTAARDAAVRAQKRLG